MADPWTASREGTSNVLLLKRDGLPIARFYAGRMELAEAQEMARALNKHEKEKR